MSQSYLTDIQTLLMSMEFCFNTYSSLNLGIYKSTLSTLHIWVRQSKFLHPFGITCPGIGYVLTRNFFMKDIMRISTLTIRFFPEMLSIQLEVVHYQECLACGSLFKSRTEFHRHLIASPHPGELNHQLDLGLPTFGLTCGFTSTFPLGFFPLCPGERYLGQRHVQSNCWYCLRLSHRYRRRRLRHFVFA